MTHSSPNVINKNLHESSIRKTERIFFFLRFQINSSELINRFWQVVRSSRTRLIKVMLVTRKYI